MQVIYICTQVTQLDTGQKSLLFCCQQRLVTNSKIIVSGVVGLSEVIFFWADVYFGVQKSGTQKLREVGLDYGASACFVFF